MPTNNSCFLCDPPRDLVFAESEEAIALAGLGPLMSGYSLVAAKPHVSSGADFASSSSNLVGFAEEIRAFLTSEYASCLLTEHGRIPVCVGPSGESDPHCFHAHFLLFPGAPPILDIARPYFREEMIANDLGDALNLASGIDEYILISPSVAKCSIFQRPGKLYPQFARALVANALGRPSLSNWKANPRRELALESAGLLRRKYEAWKA